MKISDEMREAVRDAVELGSGDIMRDCECDQAIAAVAPLIAREAKDKAASLLRALSYEREINAANVAHIEAQAKEIEHLNSMNDKLVTAFGTSVTDELQREVQARAKEIAELKAALAQLRNLLAPQSSAVARSLVAMIDHALDQATS